MSGEFMKDKRGLILGVANRRSIAWGIAQTLAQEGAQLAFAYQGDRLKEGVEELAKTLPAVSPLYSCDVSSDEEIQKLKESLEKDFGRLDFLVHSIAFARKEELAGRTVDTSRDGFRVALEISSYSLIALTKALEPLMEKEGASVVALTYLGSEKAVPHYNVMGLAKASLESSIRYLAVDLGRKNIRVNGISAGPVSTLAARGISGFQSMLDDHKRRAPLGRNVEIEEIANAALFLLSPLASGITGEILFVDCGYRHVVDIPQTP
ncbi:MAG: enoyl-ACP reductase [Candidatus Omnitrophica bacterium]|nr:enoyl-ACP reductase [Candidatus Omnitrophota bacterium]